MFPFWTVVILKLIKPTNPIEYKEEQLLLLLLLLCLLSSPVLVCWWWCCKVTFCRLRLRLLTNVTFTEALEHCSDEEAEEQRLRWIYISLFVVIICNMVGGGSSGARMKGNKKSFGTLSKINIYTNWNLNLKTNLIWW